MVFLDDENINIKLSSGHFYIGPDLCYENNITVHQDGKDISSRCVGIIAIEPKWFGEKE